MLNEEKNSSGGSRRWFLLAIFAAGLILAATLASANMAAANGDDAEIDDTALPHMVLPVADLGDEFSNYQVDPQLSGFNRPEDLDPNEVSSYALFYTKTPGADGPFEANLPATAVALYTDAGAAGTAIADGVQQFQGDVEADGGTFATFDVPALGDEAFGITGSLELKGLVYQETVVIFRTGRLLGVAFIERDDLQDVQEQAVGIARPLLERMQGVVKGDVTNLPAVLPSDVNCNGAVDSIDATLVLQLSAALIRSLRCDFLGDANSDGQTNAVDATIILQFDAGLVWKVSAAGLVDREEVGLRHLTSGIALPGATPSSISGPAMAVDCDAQAGGVQDSCSYSLGQSFDVAVNVLQPPADGYLGFQVKLSGSGGVLAYLPASDPRDEALWVGCLLPMHSDYLPSSPTALFACIDVDLPADENLNGPVEPLTTPPARMDTGAVLRLRFRCTQTGDTSLTLEPRDGDDGTLFLGPDYQTLGDAELTGAQVHCE